MYLEQAHFELLNFNNCTTPIVFTLVAQLHNIRIHTSRGVTYDLRKVIEKKHKNKGT